MKKALIRVEGHLKIGTGHVFRCLALAQYISQDFNIEFAMNSREPSLCEAIKSQGYRLHHLETLEPEDFLGLVKTGFDLIVLDGYNFGLDLQTKIRACGCRLLVIDDLNSEVFDADLVLNHANSFTPSSYHVRQGRLLLGSNFALLHPSFLALTQNETPWSGRLENALIILGGADEHNFSQQLLSVFEKIPSCQATLLLGPSNPNYSALAGLATTTKICKSVPQSQLAQLIQCSDFVVCTPSTLATEVSALRRPLALVSNADNQVPVGESLQQVGAADYFGDLKQLNEDSLRTKIETFLRVDTEKFHNMIAVQRTLVDGQSKNRICEAINSLDFLKMRAADENDKRPLYQWRNIPEIRQSSLSQDEISWETHSQWFDGKIKDPTCSIFIFSVGDTTVGVTRLDPDRPVSSMKVSIYVLPTHWKKGYASRMLKMTEDWAFHNSSTRQLNAEIRPENTASIKLFSKLGYLNQGDIYRKALR